MADRPTGPQTYPRETAASRREPTALAGAGPGIVRTVVEVFQVGEYRYARLEDAEAQARRMGWAT